MDFIRDPRSLEGVYGRIDDWDRRGESRTQGLLDDTHADFISGATMVVVASIGHGGVTCSPRGAPAGRIARVQDAHTIWVPDAAGGRVHQTVRNLMEDPRLGLLFMAPPREQVLRIEGMARVTADAEALAAFPDLDPPVRSVMVVDVQAVRMSGRGPVQRAGFWEDPATAPVPSG